MFARCISFAKQDLKSSAVASLILFLLLTGGLSQAEEAKKEIVLRGKVVCVDESDSEVSCGGENDRFALKTTDGSTFFFLSEDRNSKIFLDERLHQKELQVRAWSRGENRLEIIKVYSVKDNQLFDIYYFCRTCNIRAFVGGLCWCCQEEFEFRETPVSPTSTSEP